MHTLLLCLLVACVGGLIGGVAAFMWMLSGVKW